MTDNHKTLIQRKIRKLQQLEALLDDPDISDVVQSIIALTPKPAPVAESEQPQLFKKARRRYQRNGGSLIDRTLAALRDMGTTATATSLAIFMREQGYKFKARDANVAVSKVLRQLADAGKIKSKRGDHVKAAILYWFEVPETGKPQVPVPVYNAQVPVQEITH